MSLLVTVHYQNFFKNRTTNERFTKHNGNISASVVSFAVVDETPLNNFRNMCCNVSANRRVSNEYRVVEETQTNIDELIESEAKQESSALRSPLIE